MKNFNIESAKILLKGMRTAIVIINALILFVVVAFGSIILNTSLSDNVDKTEIILAATAGAIILSVISYMLTSRNIRHDLKTGNVITETVIAKSIKKSEDVEAGSGALYIPILGRLFPKLFGQKMNVKMVAYLITSDNVRYEVPLDVDLKKNKTFTLYFGEKTKTYLGCDF